MSALEIAEMSILQNLSAESRGVIVGTICSIVLTPIIVRLIQRGFPPLERNGTSPLSADRIRRCRRIAAQSSFAGLFALVVPLLIFGPHAPMDAIGAIMMIGMLSLGAIAWLSFCIFAMRATTLDEFSEYFEQEFRARFSYVAGVSLAASVAGLVCLFVYLGRTGRGP